MQRRRLPPLDTSSRLSSTSIQSWNIDHGGEVISRNNHSGLGNPESEDEILTEQSYPETSAKSGSEHVQHDFMYLNKVDQSESYSVCWQNASHYEKEKISLNSNKRCRGNKDEHDSDAILSPQRINGTLNKESAINGGDGGWDHSECCNDDQEFEREEVKQSLHHNESSSNLVCVNQKESPSYEKDIDDKNKDADDVINIRNFASETNMDLACISSQELNMNANSRITKLPMEDKDIREHLQSTGQVVARIITWNQHAELPSARDIAENLILHNHFHIIVFCSQECQRSISKSFFIRSKEKWESIARIAVGPDYAALQSHTLQAIHSMVFVHRSIFPYVSNIKAVSVPTGIGGIIGNKGGIGISFKIGKSSFCFVNAHLSPHLSGITRRVSEYQQISLALTKCLDCNQNTTRRILRQVVKPFRRHHQINPVSIDRTSALTDMFDFVFWAGDLNFRTNGTRAIIDGLLKAGLVDILLNNDQLSLLMKTDPLFSCLSEGEICFRPTYKFDKDSEIYDTSKKQRLPSWTDRVLFKKGSPVDLVSYSCASKLRHSDHRPVYATFRCHVVTDMRN